MNLIKVILLITFMAINDCAQLDDQLEALFSSCRIKSPGFDECLRLKLNRLNPLFKYGLPEYNVAPFDAHHQPYVEQRRGDRNGLAGYRLILRDVSEYGWTQSWITKLRMDWKHNEMVYSQQFPEKSLDGKFEFESKVLGLETPKTAGNWSLVLYDYSQTTTITRVGGPGGRIKVKVEVDKIGNMKLAIDNLFGGHKVFESLAAFVISSSWPIGVPFAKPLINDLVSTAFTDIFDQSFRYFPLEKFFH